MENIMVSFNPDINDEETVQGKISQIVKRSKIAQNYLINLGVHSEVGESENLSKFNF